MRDPATIWRFIAMSIAATSPSLPVSSIDTAQKAPVV
jgi:hypothetical protein